MRRALAPLLLLALIPATALAGRKKAAPDPDQVAAQLLGAALHSDEAYEELRWLTTHVGHRLSGSPQLDLAIAWGEREMAADGLSVSLEPVDVPRWVRGHQHAEVTGPHARHLEILTLGGSDPTPEGGITAEVLVVGSFEELNERAAEAVGKIVVYDVPFTSYGETVQHRTRGAVEAARVGGVAALVRSVTPVSLSTPHTGAMHYDDEVPKIPAAAITLEAASWLHRLQEDGTAATVHLELGPEDHGLAPSNNVVGELRGRSLPDEVIVLGCHLDSWDVGEGAQDDGAGCVTVMQAGALLASLPVGPRRTVRVVLFTNEENGLGGGRAYAEAHKGERIFAAVEDDTGAGIPTGFRLDVREAGERHEARTAAVQAHFSQWLPWLAPVGAAELTPGYSGADIGGLVRNGAVGLGLSHDMTGYWPVHHTEADTFDKIDPAAVKKNVAAMAIMAWILAEMDGPTGTM